MSAPRRQPGSRRAGSIIPPQEEIRRQVQLPPSHLVRMAWRNIRMRLDRSALVAAGIVLAMAFLSYMLISDALAQRFASEGPPRLVRELRAAGVLAPIEDAEDRVQTWWLIGLALLVCFVGVLNAMLLSVTERFGEIGTMKCLGAMDALIMRLFLVESLVQGAVGTAIGLLIGAGLAMAEAAMMFGSALWPTVAWSELAALCGLCIVAGMLLTVCGALYPAWTAARMKPIEAMRVEV